MLKVKHVLIRKFDKAVLISPSFICESHAYSPSVFYIFRSNNGMYKLPFYIYTSYKCIKRDPSTNEELTGQIPRLRD